MTQNFRYLTFKGVTKSLENDKELPPVTSSPLLSKVLPEVPQNVESRSSETWASLLATQHQQLNPAEPVIQKSKEKVKHWLNSVENSTEAETLSGISSFEPVLVHKMHVSLTPKAKAIVISDGTRRVRGRDILAKDGINKSKISETLNSQGKTTSPNSSGEQIIQKIRKEVEHSEDLDLGKIEKYQQILLDHLKRNHSLGEENDSKSQISTDDFGLLDFLQNNLENLRVSPATKRILERRQKDQHKRILSLAIAKRRSAVDIQRKIHEQQALAEQQKISRVQQEMGIEEASKRKQNHLRTVTLKLRANNTVHQRNAEKLRRAAKLQEMKQVLKSEQTKSTDQSNKIVKDVWDVLMREQYKQLLQEIRQHKELHKEYAEKAAEQLQKYKQNYEEQLREIRTAAAENAANLGSQQKDIDREIRKLRHELKSRFTTEYDSLLQKIRNRGEHHRWIREEKAAQLKAEIQRARYTFDL